MLLLATVHWWIIHFWKKRNERGFKVILHSLTCCIYNAFSWVGDERSSDLSTHRNVNGWSLLSRAQAWTLTSLVSGAQLFLQPVKYLRTLIIYLYAPSSPPVSALDQMQLFPFLRHTGNALLPGALLLGAAPGLASLSCFRHNVCYLFYSPRHL